MSRAIDTPWPENGQILRVARISNRCTVLGPGVRAVVWVQGCVFRCAECVAPRMLPFTGGRRVDVASLAAELLDLPDIEGVTFSGGEPMSQSLALGNLIDQIRARRDLSFVSYSGYTLEQLLRDGSDAQRALVARLDILIDGLYVRERHTNLRWRGSDNQRIHLLSPRYTEWTDRLDDRGHRMEFEFSSDDTVAWMGIPPRGFRQWLPAALAPLGIEWNEGDIEP